LKARVGRAAIEGLAAAISAVDAGFDAPAFVALACTGLEDLELKARVAHVADALGRHLPTHFDRAVALLCDAADRAQLDMWAAWPCLTYVEQRGPESPEVALAALARLTRHASAEFAIRPLLERYPALVFERLAEWTSSPDVHVRRLVSEGTRPRLPWGRQLAGLRRDPAPALPLLDRLRDDPEEYVRRSVANHLNDIARDHPERALAVAGRWLAEGGANVAAVVRHGLRTLVKAGHPEALALVGADVGADLAVEDLRFDEPRVRLGGELSFSFRLRNRADAPARAVVDYVIHWRRANGSLSPTVFKLATPTLAPNATVAVRRAHPIRPITTRRYYPGEQLLEVQVNGRRVARLSFLLTLPEDGTNP
jgi:3-methyladenine DNA glycosylase AlkC